MEFPRMQRRVADYVATAGLATTVPYRALDLAAETGELAKKVLKGSNYGHAPFAPLAG